MFGEIVAKIKNTLGEKIKWGVTASKCLDDKIALDVMIQDPNMTIFGETVTAQRTHDVSVSFNYNISDHDVTISDSGTGISSHDQNTLILTPGTGVGKAGVRSRHVVTYRPGSEAFGMFTMGLENGGESGLIQTMGVMDTENGFFIGYNGVDFSIALRKASINAWTADYSFNGDDISWLDPTKLNIYMIRYGWLGISPISYYVYYGPGQKWVRMHTIDSTNKQNLPHINTPVLPVCAVVERISGTGTATVMRSGSWRAGISDSTAKSKLRHFSYANTKTGVGSTLTNIFTISNKSIYQGVTNRTPIILEVISGASDGVKPAEISIWKDAILGGTPSFVDINTTNSVIEVDIAGTTVTSGEGRFTAFLGKSSGEIIPMITYTYMLHPGETFTFAGQTTSATSDISFSVNWGEIF